MTESACNFWLVVTLASIPALLGLTLWALLATKAIKREIKEIKKGTGL